MDAVGEDGTGSSGGLLCPELIASPFRVLILSTLKVWSPPSCLWCHPFRWRTSSPLEMTQRNEGPQRRIRQDSLVVIWLAGRGSMLTSVLIHSPHFDSWEDMGAPFSPDLRTFPHSRANSSLRLNGGSQGGLTWPYRPRSLGPEKV